MSKLYISLSLGLGIAAAALASWPAAVVAVAFLAAAQVQMLVRRNTISKQIARLEIRLQQQLAILENQAEKNKQEHELTVTRILNKLGMTR